MYGSCRCLWGLVYPFPFVLLKCKGDPRGGGWSLFGKKNGGELGHDNVLAALNDWSICLPFPIRAMVGPFITGVGGGMAWPAIFNKKMDSFTHPLCLNGNAIC